MKKLLSILLILLIICGCASSKAKDSFDGKDRPSNRGKLQVIDAQLCGADGQPVVLRGISGNGIPMVDRYVNNDTFKEISEFMGANVFRLALYTYGVGTVGYCTEGNKAQLKQTVENGVEYAKNNDMYAIIDWHVLDEGDPNRFIEEAKIFFDEESAKYKDYDNVIYEICNEPNNVEWKDIKQYAETIIPVIRNNDPKALIIVGTPDWSKDVDVAAEDPLDFDNILYTLHFYSASHKQELRDKAKKALDKGIGLFVTEFGITSSNGDLPLDVEEADIWIDFLEENKISYVMWQFSKVGEASAVLKFDVLKTKEFTRDDFKTAGTWLIDKIAEKSAKE